MNTRLTALFASVAAAHFLALLVPGPDFVLLVKSGLLRRRREAMGIVAGITVSNLLYVALSLAGIAALLEASPIIPTLLGLAGGSYLCFLGITALLSASGQVPDENAEGQKKSSSFAAEFRTGLAASILNPKLPLFYLGLFSLLLREGTGTGFRVAMGIWMTSTVFLWDTLLVSVIAAPAVRRILATCTVWITRLTALVLLGLGLSVIMSSFYEIIALVPDMP